MKGYKNVDCKRVMQKGSTLEIAPRMDTCSLSNGTKENHTIYSKNTYEVLKMQFTLASQKQVVLRPSMDALDATSALQTQFYRTAYKSISQNVLQYTYTSIVWIKDPRRKNALSVWLCVHGQNCNNIENQRHCCLSGSYRAFELWPKLPSLSHWAWTNVWCYAFSAFNNNNWSSWSIGMRRGTAMQFELSYCSFARFVAGEYA